MKAQLLYLIPYWAFCLLSLQGAVFFATIISWIILAVLWLVYLRDSKARSSVWYLTKEALSMNMLPIHVIADSVENYLRTGKVQIL